MLISAGDIIKNSLELYKKNWRALIPYLVLLFLPTLILSLLGVLGSVLSFYVPGTSLATNLIILAVFAASIIFSIWTSIALAHELKNLLENKAALGWKVIFASSSHLIWPMIYTSILVGIIVLAGAILLIIPGIIFAVWYAFAVYAVIFDGQKGMSALKNSKNLVVGRWWDVAWRIVAPALLFGIATVILQYLILTPFNYMLTDDFILAVASALISTIISIIITPLAAASIVILYLSAKANPASSVEKMP